jgi:hypothetical protein
LTELPPNAKNYPPVRHRATGDIMSEHRATSSRNARATSSESAPLHLVSAFATTNRIVLGQEAVADKTNETAAIPALLERLAVKDGLKGALVSIDAIATNPTIATPTRIRSPAANERRPYWVNGCYVTFLQLLAKKYLYGILFEAVAVEWRCRELVGWTRGHL